MFAIAIEYLMGWSMAAADGARKQHAEWPPHPDRLFLALAAGWFETDGGPDEERALRWLEALPAPALACSDAQPRSVVTHYVPVNDLLDADKSDLRLRKARSFPVAVPTDPVVHFLWNADIPVELRAPLTALCDKLACLGHSASVARAWLVDQPPLPTWEPVVDAGPLQMRISGAGRLDYLRERDDREALSAYAAMTTAIQTAKKGKARDALIAQRDQRFARAPIALRPEPGLWHSYRRARAVLPIASTGGSVFDPRLLVLAVQGQRLDLPSTLLLTGALRGALLRHCDSDLPEWVTGHATDGQPSTKPHLAMLPLAFAGVRHADGRILGVALAVPRSVTPQQAASALAPLLWDETGAPREIRLYDGSVLDCVVTLDQRERPPVTLDPATWTGPSTTWATVTPIVLDRHVDGPQAWNQACAVVADACERAGLPRPEKVVLEPHARMVGVPGARAFPALTRKRDGGRMAHSHAVLRFGQPVVGPLLIGAGRFRGYGLCRPWNDDGGQR